jgi:hypothetical protein
MKTACHRARSWHFLLRYVVHHCNLLMPCTTVRQFLGRTNGNVQTAVPFRSLSGNLAVSSPMIVRPSSLHSIQTSLIVRTPHRNFYPRCSTTLAGCFHLISSSRSRGLCLWSEVGTRALPAMLALLQFNLVVALVPPRIDEVAMLQIVLPKSIQLDNIWDSKEHTTVLNPQWQKKACLSTVPRNQFPLAGGTQNSRLTRHWQLSKLMPSPYHRCRSFSFRSLR